MNKDNKLSSIKTSKDSVYTVKLPFPIPSSRLKNLTQKVRVLKPLSQQENSLGKTNPPGLKVFGVRNQDFSLLEKKEVTKILPFFNRSFDKKRLKLLFSWYYANKGENAAFTLVETLQKLGFTYAMKAGISLGVDDLKVPGSKIESLTEAVESLKNTKASVESGNVTALEEFQQFVDTWHRTSENLKTSVIQNFTRGLSKKTSLPKTFKQSKIQKPKIKGLSKNNFFAFPKKTLYPLKTKGKSYGTKQSFSKETTIANTMTWEESPSRGRVNVTNSGLQDFKGFSEPGSLDSVTLQSEPLSRSYGNTLNPVYMMAFSGARGNLSQVRQLVGMRGLMADPQGQLVEFPIQSNFREGLTVTEYMISCYGARKGLVDTALRTAAAGYLTRRLVDVSHHQIVSSVTCGTKSGIRLPLHVEKQDQSIKSTTTKKSKDGKSLAFCIGRVLARDIPGVAFRNQEIDISLGSSNEFREVYENVGITIRSPLTCKSEIGICQLCYGWSVSANRLVGLGEAVGIIAAQSIGEPGTQLTMRTFHTGGVFSGDIMEECRAKHEGFVSFQGVYLGLMVRTAGGAIAFCLKTTGIMHIKGLDKLTTYTFLPNTLLFVRQGEKVEIDTLLAQIPNLPEIEESTGESTKTIVSSLSGEVRQTPMLNKELENIRILAGQEDVSVFCSTMSTEDVNSSHKKETIEEAFLPLGQTSRKLQPLSFSMKTPQTFFLKLKKEKGINFLHSIPRITNQKSQDNQKSLSSEIILDRWSQKHSTKKKVYLIKGSHRLGNHTRTYKKTDSLALVQFLYKKQKSIQPLSFFKEKEKAQVLGHWEAPSPQKSNSFKAFADVTLGKSFDPSLAQTGHLGNQNFVSKITKLLTENNLKTGVLGNYRSLKFLKKQKSQKTNFILNILPKPKLNDIKVLQKTGLDPLHPRSLWVQDLVGPRVEERKLKSENLSATSSTGAGKTKLQPLDSVNLKKPTKVPLYSSVLGSSFLKLGKDDGLKDSGQFFKLNTFFLYRVFFLHPYNPPLTLYKLKNPISLIGMKALRQGVIEKNLVRKKAVKFQKKLQIFHPFLGKMFQSFHSNLINKNKKSFFQFQECSYFLWWPLKMQDSNFETQKVKFYTLLGKDKTISLSKPLKLSNYSYLFWKFSYLLFVKSLSLKKHKPSFLKKRILKNRHWWGSTGISSLVPLLNKNIRISPGESVPVDMLSKENPDLQSYKPKHLEQKTKNVLRELVSIYPVVKPWPRNMIFLQKSRRNKKGLCSLKGLPNKPFFGTSLKNVSAEISSPTALPLLLRTPLASTLLAQKDGLYSTSSSSSAIVLTSYQKSGSFDPTLPISLKFQKEQGKENSKNFALDSFGQKLVYSHSLNPLDFQRENLDSFVASQKSGEIFPIQGNTSLKNFETFYTSSSISRKREKEDRQSNRTKELFSTNSLPTFLDENSQLVQSIDIVRDSETKKDLYFTKGLSPHSKSKQQSPKKENLILTHSDRISYNLRYDQSIHFFNHSEKNPIENSQTQKPLNRQLLGPLFYKGKSLLDNPSTNVGGEQTQFLKPKIGYYINSGDEVIKNFGSAHCGQIIEKSYYQLTLRLTQNVLFSNLRNRPAIVSQEVQDGRWLCKGTSLVTLPYISSVTGDIVAGIPKIEQLFEARGEALEKTVDKMWLSYKTAVVPRAKAVRECFKEIGLFVVAAIQKVYSSQGVKIADKHLEVIIRQMIGRALIVDPGDTPFLPDEFVDLQTIERVNWTTYGERATYRPRLVGITKASLTTNSFLSSASFQQTARVLERETFLEKTDRLLGLKERVMMGALINAGTGNFHTGVVLSKVSQNFVRKN